jgi:probable phosphoglycerate mutase
MTTILLIRHGLTDETGKILSGRSSGLVLNAEGREQARRLPLMLQNKQIAAIFSSPLERTIETASPLSDTIHLPLILSEDFLEVDFGEWTNRSIETLRNDPLFIRFNTFRSCTRPPGGELMSEVQLRMIRGLERIQETWSNQTVAIFSHGDPIRAAIGFYAGIHPDLLGRLEISPASVSTIELYPDTARIISVNETCSST